MFSRDQVFCLHKFKRSLLCIPSVNIFFFLQVVVHPALAFTSIYLPHKKKLKSVSNHSRLMYMPAYNQRVWIKRKTTFSAVVYFALNNYTFLEGQQQRCRCILATIRAPLFAIRHHLPSYFLLYSCILSSTEQKKKKTIIISTEKRQNILLRLKLSSQIASWVIIILLIINNNNNGSANDLELQKCICHPYCNWSSWDYK